MTLSIIGPAVCTLGPDEQIDVLQIRLWNARSAMAFLGAFHCADRMLAAWGSSPGSSRVSFEIRFVDGHVVRGSHEFFRNGKRRCLLTTHVRRLMAEPDLEPEPGLARCVRRRPRYLIPR